MKTIRAIHTRNMMLSLMIIAGFAASCEKTEIKQAQPEIKKATVTIRALEVDNEREGDDDDENPRVNGSVENGSGSPIIDAAVRIFEVGTSTPLFNEITDINGNFTMWVPSGNYYFKITEQGIVTTTNNFNIAGNSALTITLK